MITKSDKNKARLKRHLRVRKKIEGTTVRPRLNIFRSSKHMYAQLIDDTTGVTIVAASTQDKELKSEVGNGGNVEAARKVGALIAATCERKRCSTKWYLTAVDTFIMDVFKHWLTQLVKLDLNSRNTLIRR